MAVTQRSWLRTELLLDKRGNHPCPRPQTHITFVGGELLARMGRLTSARRQLLRAAELTSNDIEQRVLLRKAAAINRHCAVQML